MNIHKKNLWIAMMFLLLSCIGIPHFVSAAENSTTYGIRITSQGKMTLNNNYFRMMGVNGFDFASKELAYKASTLNLGTKPSGYKTGDYKKNFETIKQYNIPFARIPFCTFQDAAYKLFDYSSNHKEFFEVTDEIVKTAEENNIGIIIDFFWNDAVAPYHVGEQRAELGNPNSKTIAFQKKYISAIINRYKNSPAVWGYEIGNEYNLIADLVRDIGAWVKIPNSDSVYDHITTNELATYYETMGEFIESKDSTRLITTGDSESRESAYSLYQATKDIYYSNHRAWQEGAEGWAFQGKTNYVAMIQKLNPSGINTISCHLYTRNSSNFGSGISGFIATYQTLANKIKKPVYIGEFAGPPTTNASFEEDIRAIVNSEVQLSSPWLCDDAGNFLQGNSSYTYAISRVRDYNTGYKSVVDSAWNAWKKDITVTCTNGTYSLTKENNYTNQQTNNSTSSYYLAGDKVTIQVTPKTNYTVSGISVKTVSGQTVSVSNNRFVMPNEDVIIDVMITQEVIPIYTITIIFQENGGSGSMTSISGNPGNYTLPANQFTAPSGKRFKCWSINGTEKAVGAVINVSSNIIVEAVWEDIPVTTYTISFNANGGSGSMASVNCPAGNYTLPSNQYTAPNGKKFKCWKINGTEKAVGAIINVSSNITVVAVWEDVPVDTFVVSFETNGGNRINSQEVVSGNKAKQPTAPTKANCTFEGWYRDSALQTVFDFNTPITANIVLYAKWTVNPDITEEETSGGEVTGNEEEENVPTYKIKTIAENGTISPSSPMVKENDSQLFTFQAQKGYEIIDVIVDNQSMGAIESYRLNNVHEKHTIELVCEKIVDHMWSYASNWAIPELKRAQEKNIIPETFYHFDYTRMTNRAEGAAVAVKLYEALSKKKTKAVQENPFVDSNDDWVLRAYSVGITNGTSETTFDPNLNITREQMATMLTRALQKAGINTSVDLATVTRFVDDDEIHMHDWGRPSIYFMTSKGIIKGMGDGRFGGLENATIEQTILIALRSVENLKR